MAREGEKRRGAGSERGRGRGRGRAPVWVGDDGDEGRRVARAEDRPRMMVWGRRGSRGVLWIFCTFVPLGDLSE